MSVASLEAIDLLDYDLFADHEPWEAFDLLLREAPVYRHPMPGGDWFWVITRYDDVLAVVRDPGTFSSEVGGSATIENLPEDVLDARRNFLEFDPPKHGRYRRLISTSFTPGAVAQYEEWLRALVSHLLDRVCDGEEFDLIHELAAPIPIRVLARVLGLPDQLLPRLVELGDRLLVDTDPEIVGDAAYHGERPEDRYKPFGSPWAEERGAARRCADEDRGRRAGRLPAVRAQPRQHVRPADCGRQRNHPPGDRSRDAGAGAAPGRIRAPA
jgi:cytochrome P450